MIQIIARILYSPGNLSVDLPPTFDTPLKVFTDKLRGGPAVIQLKKWYKSRTTGWKSQNHHIHGHEGQLSQELAIDPDTLHLYLKNAAIKRGYPYDILDDCVFPWSESRVDSLQASFLIDEIHTFAAEHGVNLIEEEF